jgi:hypothetical protein
MSSVEIANPGGHPSTTQPIAGPCDSPKEETQKSFPNVLPDILSSLKQIYWETIVDAFY